MIFMLFELLEEISLRLRKHGIDIDVLYLDNCIVFAASISALSRPFLSSYQEQNKHLDHESLANS